MEKHSNIDSYIDSFPKETQLLLNQVREAIQNAAPKAIEVMSYGMPAFKLNRVLVYFAGYKNHIGFYPTASGIAAFKKDLLKFKGAKGSVQFPLVQPMPLAIIKKITKFRVREDSLLSKPRTTKQKSKAVKKSVKKK